MALRELVEDDYCAVPGAVDSRSRNPLTQFLHSFVETSRTQQQIREVQLPTTFSPLQQEKIRNRSNVMARQFFPDAPEQFVNDQVTALCHSLNVDASAGAAVAGPAGSDSVEDVIGKQLGELGDEFEDEGEGWGESGAIEGVHPAIPREYLFAENNQYLSHAAPYREGVDFYHAGNLSEAILALEAEVQKNPQNSDAWRLLGATHAENDDDRRAIAPLLRAVESDPNNLDALLDLGVSFTNELVQAQALNYLKQWIARHPRYQHLRPTIESEEEFVGTSTLHGEVTNLFHQAAALAPDDPDVHTVLGVLFNLSREYDKAIQSFQAALNLKPNDFSLWNKLGATQANSFRSEEAVAAYSRALDLKPRYVRAFVNLGIAYFNQTLYDEAARHYIRALTMNPNVDHAWNYLRMTFACMERGDLDDLAAARNLDGLVREFPL